MKAVAITGICVLAALGAQGAIFTEDWESGLDSSVWSTWGGPHRCSHQPAMCKEPIRSIQTEMAPI